MKNPITYFRKSLSTRLCAWILLFAALIFIAAVGFMFSVSRNAIRQEAINGATCILDNTVLRVNSILDRVVVTANNLEWLPLRHINQSDSMFVYTKAVLRNNPNINGCCIAFEPDFFKDRGRYFAAYSYNDNGNILTTQRGNDQYEYFYMDWYQQVKLLDKPGWTEPYFDYNPKDIYSKDMIASYCKPMKSPDGEYIGTISIDISLEWLSQTISNVKPYPNSFSIMIGKGGTFFVHPDTTKLFYESIFTETLEHPDTAITALGHAMQNGESGVRMLNLEGHNCYVFYKPLSDTGWSVAIVCTETDIFGGYNKLQRIVTGIYIIGLLLIALIFSRMVSWELKPLNTLALQAEKIASGNFDTTLPDENRIDEIGQLSLAFSNMQHSLVKYIEELKKTTTMKAIIENELKVASDIQQSMLPKIFPPYPDRNDIDIYGSLISAKEVGGDLFDFYVRDDMLFFCIGDVSGKGIPASLLMTVTRSQFRTISGHLDSPEKIAIEMNNLMSEGNESGMFVTFFIGCLILDTGRLKYCCCGHNPPLIIDDKVSQLPVVFQLPIGAMKDIEYELQEIQLTENSTIFLYTDGLTEAETIDHDPFGEERMLNTANDVLKNGEYTPKTLINRMLDEVHKFVGDAPQSDDLTMLAVRHNSKRKPGTTA